MDWLTAEEVAEAWDQAPDDDELLERLVGAALHQVEEYAPVIPDDLTPAKLATTVAAYQQAQLMQTRNLWNAQSAQAGGDGDGGEFILRPVPLDWQVKALLRPKTGVPVIG